MKKKQRKFIDEMEALIELGFYKAACEEVVSRLEGINDDVFAKNDWVLINDISYRVKEPTSCMNKMIDKGYALKADNAQKKLNDIAGVRAVCYFLDDVYVLANKLMESPEYEFVKLKDYIKKPKSSGYQSLHLIIKVPVTIGEISQQVKVEIQIRTRAMDFWSDIEHHFIYKTKDIGNTELSEYEEEFLKCSKSIQRIDKQMLKIKRKMDAKKDAQTW